jgi:hypothetical protein
LRRELNKDIREGAEKAGIKYLDQIFRDKKVHRAILDVLKSSIKEKSFVQESRKYGILLINEAFKDPVFRKHLKHTVLRIINTDSVKKDTVDLLKFMVTHQITKVNMIEMMTHVMTNEPTKTSLIMLLGRGALQA